MSKTTTRSGEPSFAPVSIWLAILLLTGPALAQEPPRVTIQLGTADAATGGIAIGDDGTMAWVESDGEVARVYRRSPDGEVELVVEHAVDRFSLPTVMDDGTVLLAVQTPASGRSDVYVEDALVYTDQSGPLVHRPTGFVSALWTGSGYGEIAEYDVLAGTGEIHALPQEYDDVHLLAGSGTGLVFLRIDSADPAVAGFYFWQDGQLTREEIEDPPEDVGPNYEFDRYGYGDISGNRLAYTYKVTDEDLYDDSYGIIVVKDLVTSETSVYAAVDESNFYFGYSIRIDALGRVFYLTGDDTSAGLAYVENGIFRYDLPLGTSPYSYVWDINAAGRGVLVTETFDCDPGSDPYDPNCTENVAFFDVGAGSYRVVSDNGQYAVIVDAYINESDDIIFVRSDWEHFVTTDLTAPGRTAAASVIDVLPPTVPTGLVAAGRTESAIDLAWNASTDAVGLGGYDVFRDNVLIATVPAPGYRDTGLRMATSYTYRIEAFDLVDNRTASPPVILSTLGTGTTVSKGSGSIGFLTLAWLALAGLLRRRMPR